MAFSFRRALVLFTLLAGLGGVPPDLAWAQEDGDSGAQELPEIAPQEFEIRGQLQINFPSLERQPLRGFAAPSSVPTLPPNRMPHVEPYKQERSSLPEALPEPPTSTARLATAPPPANGMVEAGAGRFLTRFARGRLSVPVSTAETISLRGAYDGTEGFEPFDDSSVETPSDVVTGALRFDSRRRSATVGAEIHGFVEDYSLYGAQPIPTTVPTAARLVAPDRSGQSGGIALDLSTHGTIPVTASLAYDQSHYETQFQPDSIADASSFDEGRLRADASVEFPVGLSVARLDATMTTAGLDGNGAFSGDVATVDAGGSALVVQQGPFTAFAGARLLAFSALADPTAASPGETSGTFVLPFGRGEWSPDPTLTLYAQNAPRLVEHDLPSIYATNPFTTHAPAVQPTLETTRFEAGVEYTVGTVRLTGHGGYRYAPNFLYFAPTSEPGFEGGFFDTVYDSAQIFEAGGGLALLGSDRVQASATLTYRNGTLNTTDTAIPNFAPFVAEGMVTVSFSDGRGFLEIAGTLESPRYVDRREDETVGTYAELDVDGSFAVSPLLDVVAGVHNLGAGTLERWDRYERPPAILTAGLRIHW